MKKAIIFMLFVCLVFSKGEVVTAKYIDVGNEVDLVQSASDLLKYLEVYKDRERILYLEGLIDLKDEKLFYIPKGITLFISRRCEMILPDIPFCHEGVIYVAGRLDLRKMSRLVSGDGTMETTGLGGRILYNPSTLVTPTPEPTATPSPTVIPEVDQDPVPEKETAASPEGETAEVITIRKMDSQASSYYVSNHSFLKTIPKIKKIQKKKRHIRITWKKITKASGYELQIQTGKKRSRFCTGKTSYARSLQRLKTKEIRVRVRAYKGKKKRTYTKWSSWKKYKVVS